MASGKTRRLIVGEGPTDDAFFRALIKRHTIPGFGLYQRKSDDPTGEGSFTKLLQSIKVGTEYSDVELVVLVRDCDDCPDGAFKSAKNQIANAGGYAVPSKPREVAQESGKKNTSVLMIPWDDECGSLETVCYAAAKKKRPDIAKCAERFAKCVKANKWKPQQRSKLQLGALLSGSCEREPGTSLVRAWAKSKRRPPDLIPLDGRLREISRVIKYLRSLP